MKIKRRLTRLFKSNWSHWHDIKVFSYGNEAYLLQGKRNIKTNRKKFKMTSICKDQGYNVSEEELRDKGLFK